VLKSPGKQSTGTGWMGFGHLYSDEPGCSYNRIMLKACGYPGDKQEDTLWCADECLLTHTYGCPIHSNGWTDEPCVTYYGQSGGPLFDNDGVIYGVLSGK
jgi:hypothetical protein